MNARGDLYKGLPRNENARYGYGWTSHRRGLAELSTLATRILRRHAELVGLKANFTILDTDALSVETDYGRKYRYKRWQRALLQCQRWKDKVGRQHYK